MNSIEGNLVPHFSQSSDKSSVKLSEPVHMIVGSTSITANISNKT